MVRESKGEADTVGPVRKARLAAVVAAVCMFASACGNSGAPTSYSDNPADYKGVPNVGQAERNFRDGCEDAGKEDLDQRVQENLSDVCKCGFDRIRENLTFDEFKDLDDDLRSDINADLTEDVNQIMRGCILEESGLG